MEVNDWRRIALPDAVRALVAAHAVLVAAFSSTNLRFTLDGKFVGDLGEATAADAFGLQLCRVRTAGVDAHAPDGRSVQVKATGIGKGPAFTPGEGRADHLIFLLFDFDRALAHVGYNGPEAPVRAHLPAGFIGTKRVSIPKVRELDAAVEDRLRLRRVSRKFDPSS
ncbi:hypothetical protein C8J43_101722 [Sphingomonas sp. PP-CE-1G-424]|nr:hypothetical protein C8J43_101722 [Sphingomonas sp. PP-CE-1G-424]